MYARLVSFTGVDPEKREPAVEKMKTTVIPMLQTYNGFAGYISLYDEGNPDEGSVLFYNDRAGILELKLGTGKFGWRFQNVDGKTVDAGVQSCR